MEDLYPQFEELFIELAVILHGKVPNALMGDIEFFITEPYMSATCRTNTTLAYRIGNEISLATGSTAIAVKALHILFLARDSMIKGCPESSVKDLLDKCKEFVRTYDLCSKLELNYG